MMIQQNKGFKDYNSIRVPPQRWFNGIWVLRIQTKTKLSTRTVAFDIRNKGF